MNAAGQKLFLVLFMGAAFDAVSFNVALASQCPAGYAAHIVLDIRSDEVREVVDTSRRDLDRLAADNGRSELLPVFGQYTAAFGYNIDADSKIEQAGDTFCAVPKWVRIRITLSNRILHLAKETQSDSCLLTAIREHELLHARADERILGRQATPLLEQLNAVTNRLNGAESEASAKKQLADVLTNLVSAQFQDLNTLRQRLNATLDMPDMISRLHTACETNDQHP